MKTKITNLCIALGLMAGLGQAGAQSTAFTYQGRLTDTGSLPNGNYDAHFYLRDAATTGNPVGTTNTIAPISVSNGLFTVTLDFGPGIFTGPNLWLEIGIRTNGSTGAYTTLVPRQALTPAPYAIEAGNVNGLQVRNNPGSGAPNIIGGDSLNYVAPGTVGAVIGGGGATNYSGSAYSNSVSGDFGVIGGGNANSIGAGAYSAVGGGFANIINYNSGGSTVGGGTYNQIGTTSFYSGIAAGYQNSIAPNCAYAFVGGGVVNFAGGAEATVVGGEHNQAWGQHAFLGGGAYNSASNYDVIVGGSSNRIGADFSFIGAGVNNSISGTHSWGVGGDLNNIAANYSGIGGGYGNSILLDADYSFVGGGSNNSVQVFGLCSTIAGGMQNNVGGFASTIAGGQGNNAGYVLTQYITENTNGSVVTYITNNYVMTTNYATVGGGLNNTASGLGSFVGGGAGTYLATDPPTFIGGNVASGVSSVIAGGVSNTASGVASVICGGVVNNEAGDYSIIGGGDYNSIAGGTDSSTIAGGGNNNIYDSYDVISGGVDNVIDGGMNVIGGGRENAIGFYYNEGSQLYSTIGGGYSNFVNAAFGTVPGGDQNVADQSCFAAGHRAKATHIGSFVWADSTDTDFADQAANQFLVRATGGIALVTTNSGFYRGLELFTSGACEIFSGQSGGNVTGVYLPSGSGSWTMLSDRNSKENISSVDGQRILDLVAAMPVGTWNYKTENKSIRHLGPMAQDFYSAFGIGEDDRHIANVDEEGVALAAIKGLNERLEGRTQVTEGEIAGLKAENAELKQKNDSLEKRLEALEQIIRNKKSN